MLVFRCFSIFVCARIAARLNRLSPRATGGEESCSPGVTAHAIGRTKQQPYHGHVGSSSQDVSDSSPAFFQSEFDASPELSFTCCKDGDDARPILTPDLKAACAAWS